MYVFECRAECRTHSSIFKVCFILNAELNVELTARYSRCMFSNAELNVETHSSIFKVCIILNAELNVDLTARYSRCMFSNAELNVEPIARYSKCVLF